MTNHYVAIMAGGIGSRFWPKSRVNYPKQFLDILDVGRTLLQLTYDRFRKVCPQENIFIVTNERYTSIVMEQLPNISREQILEEPLRRNTAPCISYVTNKIAARDPEASLVVTPADHFVMNTDEFAHVVEKGLAFVDNNDALLTLGIQPTKPDTGYGYIQYIEERNTEDIFQVKTFTEKPTLEIAKTFLQSGDFLWNSGIFLWNIPSIQKAFQEHLPDIHEAFSQGQNVYFTEDEKDFIAQAYSVCTNISIDFGIMEKAENVYVIPSQFGWSDLGTWSSLYNVHDKDNLGNAVSGKDVMIYDAKDCMVMGRDGKLIVLQGLENYCVIDTKDTLLICEKSKEQEIKDIANDVKRMKGEAYL